MTGLEIIKAHRSRIERWQSGNMKALGTPRFRRCTLAHRLLTDLIALRGGNELQRAFIIDELKAINAGKRDKSQ